MQAEVNPNEDTEFHDALRKHGIIPPKPPSRSPSPEPPTEAEQKQSDLNNASIVQIDRALEADSVGEGSEEEERLLLKIRQQRMEALAQESRRGRFGRVYPISRPDYTREVTLASKTNPDTGRATDISDGDKVNDDGIAETGAGAVGGDKQSAKPEQRKGTGVVCFLYKDSVDECRLLAGYLDRLAAKYPATKFVSIVGDQCIPNYPDKNLPTLLVYRNGDLHRQIVGLRPEIGLDGIKTKCEDIELLLIAVGVIDRSNVAGAPTHLGTASIKNKSEQRAAEHEEAEDEDDELDWDM